MEWLTTGKMIDRLNIGEVAESNAIVYGKTHMEKISVIKSESGAIVYHDAQEMALSLNQINMKYLWRILPKYVSFEEAMKALKEGYDVRCYPEDEDSFIEFNEADKVEQIGSTWKGITFGDMCNGKWTIEGDKDASY